MKLLEKNEDTSKDDTSKKSCTKTTKKIETIIEMSEGNNKC